MFEYLTSLPSLVLAAYAVCLVALSLFSFRLYRERRRLRLALQKHEQGCEKG